MQFLICQNMSVLLVSSPQQNMSVLLVSVIPSFKDYVDPMADWLSDCQIEQETDYTGADLASIGVGSQQDCADLCASTKLGLVWTWSGSRCYIKSSISGRRDSPGLVSGNFKCGSKATGESLSYLNAKNII